MTAPVPVGGFAVAAEFSDARVVLVVRGGLDSTTAPEFASVVDAVINRGNLSVVLDLAECDFIDARGLQVIAEGANRAGLWGGELSIRSPSGVVRRLLDITGLDMASLGRPRWPVLERPLTRPETVLDPSPYGLSALLGQLDAVITRQDMIDTALRLLVALARESVGGAHGVSVSLRRGGELTTVAASDETVLNMDADQYATGEGPCVDASAEGQSFYTRSLPTETRWPAFTPRAQALGINAILSSPLLSAGSPTGALNIYSRTAGAFGLEDQRRASVFAAEASTVLTDAAGDVTADHFADRLEEVLRTRQVIALAQGVMTNATASARMTPTRRFVASR